MSKIKFVKREDIINFYLDLMNSGKKLTEEQLELLTYLSKIKDDKS